MSLMSQLPLMSHMSHMPHMTHHLHIHHDRLDHHDDDHNPHNHDRHISEVAEVQPLGEIPQKEPSLRLSPTNQICSAFPGPGGQHCNNKGCPKTPILHFLTLFKRGWGQTHVQICFVLRMVVMTIEDDDGGGGGSKVNYDIIKIFFRKMRVVLPRNGAATRGLLESYR